MIAAAACVCAERRTGTITAVATWSLASAVRQSNMGLASGPWRGEMVKPRAFLSPRPACVVSLSLKERGCGNVACGGDQG